MTVNTGERIKAQRKKRDITQLELAEAIGCSPQVISNIERGYTGCSSVLVAKIAEVLGIPADDLLKDNADDSFFLTKEEKEFVLQYRMLEPNERKMLRCMLSAFMNSN